MKALYEDKIVDYCNLFIYFYFFNSSKQRFSTGCLFTAAHEQTFAQRLTLVRTCDRE